MLTTSSIVLVVGFLASSFLASGEPELRLAYVVAFCGVGMNAIFGPYIYALQALSLSRWNLVRVSQPVLNFAAVIIWYLMAPFTVLAASLCLLLSYALQLLFAYISGRRAMLKTEPEASVTAGQLLRFGLKQASSAVPQTLASSLDRCQRAVPAVISFSGRPRRAARG